MLRADVLVDEHEWKGSADATYPAVLQAGSAVLVDDARPAQGALHQRQPARTPDDALGDDLAGTPWRWFAPSAVATVNPADRPLPAFPAIDLESGAAVQIPARH